MKEIINRSRPSERDNIQDISETMFYKLNEIVVKFFDEKIELELDKRTEKGAIDFKLFILEQYYYILLSNKKENKEIQKRYFKLMNKYLKNEIDEIGYNKYFLYMLNPIMSNDNRPSELNYLAMNEIIKYLNDNIPRMKEIWEINIEHKPEKNLIKNSLEKLDNYTTCILSNIKAFFIRSNNASQNNISLFNNNDYMYEFNKQRNIFLENMNKIFSFFKKIEKEEINDNNKNVVQEKFFHLFLQILNLFLRIKPIINKEEAEFLGQSCRFILIKSTSPNLIDGTLLLFWDLIKYSGRSLEGDNDRDLNNNQNLNCLYDELFKNWKIYFNYEIYLENKYFSESKINKILSYFIKYFTFCFNGNGGINRTKGHQFLLFKNMIKLIEEDKYKMPMKLIEKINDSDVSLENKYFIINLIYDLLNWIFAEQNKINYDYFEIVYNILNQLTIFLNMLYSLHKDSDNIGIFIKEERQIQKDFFQKNMLEINLDNEKEKIENTKRYNLNGIFYILTKGKYEKFIYIKDFKYFFEILKSSNNLQHSLLDIISKIIQFFKIILRNISLEDKQKKAFLLDKISNILSKFFFYYFFIYEKLRTNHQIHEPNDQNKIIDVYIKELIEDSNLELFISVFKKLMPYIYKLYKHGSKMCPTKTCFSQKLIHNIYKNIKDEDIKEKLFIIYFEYFTKKLYEMGNPKEIFNSDNNNIGLNESINNITILKSIFFNLLECINDIDFFKNNIIPLIIDILYLSKNSELFGNYIYILRCFFKYIKTYFNNLGNNDEARNKIKDKKKLIDDFNFEINYILYAILKYFVNLKEKAPFFNDMISEIIMVMPIKPRYLYDVPHLLFPSLVDNLINGNDNIQNNLLNLETWTNTYYIKNAESVVPFITDNMHKITDFLSDNLLRPVNINTCLASLKWLSKLGGKGRNFFREKKITAKTCPIQILSMKLFEEKNMDDKRKIELILDYIIDIDIDNCINWSNKNMHKKGITNADKKLIFNYIEIFKNCLTAFFNKKIDYNYILEIKKNIINNKDKFNEKEFNSEYSFKQMNEKNSKIKINSIFRKKDHFFIGKIITGYILINSSYIQIHNLQNDDFFKDNNLMNFISYYFIMILLSKEKNNKNIFLFEQDPIFFLDELIQFLFSSFPTIIKNTNVQLTEYTIKVINHIIETINNFFDNDVNVIKNLEIVDIIYFKFLNCCYVNEISKIDVGLILIKILLKKFDKKINYKYLKYIIKSISSVTFNYNNIVKLQFKKGSNNLLEVIECLIDMFVINDKNYIELKEEYFDINNINKNNDDIIIQSTKENFIMLFDFIKYSFDDIVDKINTEKNYTRDYCFFLIKKILEKIPSLKNIIPYLLQLDINKFTIIDFLKFFKESNSIINYSEIITKSNMNIEINKENKNNNDYILPNFEQSKIYNKIDNIINALTHKLNIREKKFSNLISNSDALNNIFEISPCLIKEYIEHNDKIKLYLDLIQSLYHNLLINYFNYAYILIYISNSQENFKSRYIYLFMEQLLIQNNLEFIYEINDEKGNKIRIENEIPNNYIKYVEKFVYEQNISVNEVNNRDCMVGEMFEFLGLKINMIINYIKLLNNIYSKKNAYFIEEKNTNDEINIFNEYKKKITKIIFLQVLNMNNDSIIKQSSIFLCNIFNNDKNIRNEIYKEFNDKISSLISMINIEDIRKSKCFVNYEIVNGLQTENINSLLIICKSMKLSDNINIKNKLIQNLKHFENILDEKFENSQIILFYGFISIFLYIDISDNKEFIYRIFKQIISRIKESMVYPVKNLVNFNQIKYRKKFIKLITKYRQYFSEYIIEDSKNKYQNKYIIKLIKLITSEENNSSLICENLFKEITKEFKNKIINESNDNFYINNETYLIKITHLLKICKIISCTYKLYLKSTSFLEIIEPFINNFIKKFEKKNSEIFNPKSIFFFKKILKYWVELNIFYMKNFRKKKFCLINLFHYKSIPNLPFVEKNKIDILMIHNMSIVNKYQNENNYEKNYKYIMNLFISFDSDIKKYFDYFVDVLIIPMIINYYKNKNFFKYLIKKEDVSDEINNNNKKENDFSSEDEEYLIDILEKLTDKMYKIKFKKEKKEESKYKLVILLIILFKEYKEYLSSNNKLDNNNKKLKKIYYNIQALLDYSPLYEKNNHLGLWRIYLFFAICIFTEQNILEQKNNLEIIFNFIQRFNDDYSDIQNIIYELILPNCENDITKRMIFSSLLSDNLLYGFFFFKLLLKFPWIFKDVKNNFFKDFLSYLFKMKEAIKYVDKKKNLFVQIIGLITSYIQKEKKENNIIEQDLEKKNFQIASKIYRVLLLNIKEKDTEINELFKKMLYYFREICSTKVNLTMDVKIQDKTKVNSIHSYVIFLRICFYCFGFDSLLKNEKNIEFYFELNKYFIEEIKINHRIFNDYMLIFRLLVDTETFYQLNKKEKPNDIYNISFKKKLMNEFLGFIKDKNNMKNKFTNYDIKEFISQTLNVNIDINIKISDHYEFLTKKILTYLIEKKFYPDINAPIQLIQPPSQNTTLSSTDTQNQNIFLRQQMQPISQDKWLETFHIYDFKIFIFCRKFFEDFYSELQNMIGKVNNYNTLYKNIPDINMQELKTDLENKLKLKQDYMEIIYFSTFSFLENFYFFTLFFLKEYYVLYKKGILYNNSLSKDTKDYFESTHCFFYTLRNYNNEDLIKIKKEQFEILINDNENDIKKYAYNIACIYPDVILSAFLFFFQCDEIMENYYNIILELFLHTYKFLKDKYYESCFEYLIEEIVIKNKIMKKKPEEKNKFIFKFLKIIDQLNAFKSVRTNENIIFILVKYYQNYLKEFDMNNKIDIYINKILRIFLFNSSKLEIEKRTIIYDLIKSYIGNDLISYLKWIFTIDDIESSDVYSYVFLESIPISIDFLLSFFKQGIPLIMNQNNVSKFKNLSNDNNNIINKIELEVDEIYDKNSYIKNIVDYCNMITKEKKVEDLLNPIRTIITIDNSYYKVFIIIFIQLWKMLSTSEREIITVYINEFLYKYASKQKERNNVTINLLFDTFIQCSPIIYIKPIVIQALMSHQNYWSINILYLENLLLNGIDVPNTYAYLIRIFNSLKENDLSNGLKYYFSENVKTKEAFGELLVGNYLQAENIFYDCIDKLNKDVINNNEINLDENIFGELNTWEDGLIDCYENEDKWNNIIELSDLGNHTEMKLKGLWLCGKEKWNLLDDYIKSIPQYNGKAKENNNKYSHIIQINEIYSLYKKLIEDSNNINNNINNKSQNACMKCIQNIYQDFSSLHPKNMENIDYYYFLIFQLAVESWESMNTLNETIIKLKTGTQFNFKDNFLLWRERLPHYCEGYKSLKNVLEPRNYLFTTLKNLVKEKIEIGVGDMNNLKFMPFFSDKIWNDMIYMKYARKLNLIETFYEKQKLFEEENKDTIKIYPYENYLKDIECLKLIKKNTFNYDKGIILCDEYINKYKTITEINYRDFVDYITNNLLEYKAYFNYKKGNIIDAHNLFIQASLYKNKPSTNYHLYSDWAEMCEEITFLTSETEESNDWFDNTIHNFIYSIIYKLSKAKFIIPRMISFIKEFENKKMKNKFNEDLDEIPIWVWIFWLPVLFENFNFYSNDEEKNEFYFYILKKIAKEYKQIFYYAFNVYNKIILDKKMTNRESSFANNKYEELYKILSSENKYNHIIDKINIIISELTKKEEKNRTNPLNSILTIAEKKTFREENISNIKAFFKVIQFYLSKFDDLSNFTEDISNLMNTPDVTRKQLREFVIKKKNYIHNLIVTENKYEELSKLMEEKLFNIDFSNIEVPGFFSNKIIEPNENNVLFISKFECEFSHKLITDSRTNILIRCNNDKLLYFILENQDAENNIDNKINLMQILFNHVFEKNLETYKRKIKFLIPIKYFLSSKIKIIEENINTKYNMDEVYEYCLQKRGYDPHISYQVFEEEGTKNNLDQNYLYYSDINKQKVFEKMCKILPQDSFKNYVHKFILSSDDILLFRRQFAISYGINNLMNFIFNEDIILKNISFNKDNGFCFFNTDLTMFTDNEYKDLLNQKTTTCLRLTKNISHFLNMTSVYGIIPNIFYFSCKALINKSSILKAILKICLDNGNNYQKIEKIANNYINKFKYMINDKEDKDYFVMDNDNNNMEIDEDNKELKNIMELIENSMSDEILKKKPIDYEAWF